MINNIMRLGLLALFISALSGCGGSDGAAGPAGATGATGPQGPVGASGVPVTGNYPIGSSSLQMGSVWAGAPASIKVSSLHGAAVGGQAARGTNNALNVCSTITGATVDGAGKVAINFNIKNIGADKTCNTADDAVAASAVPSSVTVRVAMLRNGDAAGDSTYWVNYSNNNAVVKAAGVGTTPAGTTVNQPNGESAASGLLATDGAGNFTYTTNLVVTGGVTIAAPTLPAGYAGDTPKSGSFPYDANLTHRVSLQLGDIDGTGPLGSGANNPVFDFVPAAGPATVSVADPREVVVTNNCNECHATLAFHGGGRLDTKLCVVCHNPTNVDPESGNTLDFKVMIHKIHMSKKMPSIQFDFKGDAAGNYNDLNDTLTPGVLTDNPVAAVKGKPYVIWGHLNTKFDFSEGGFPANVANCTKCHKNATKADNWKTAPSKEACGACHDGINFADGSGTTVGQVDPVRGTFPGSKVTANASSGHMGGPRANNSQCAACHTDAGPMIPLSGLIPIPAAHNVYGNLDASPAKTKTDYIIDVTMSAPANGTYYVAAESAPVVTVVIKDAATGTPIDHTTALTAPTGLPSGYGATANLYVYGNRALKKPVLTTAAKSTTASTAGNSLLLSSTDPKITRTAANIKYQLDSVAGLKSGTYFAMVLATKPAASSAVPNTNTMSRKHISFQVGTATVEPKIAACTGCHENAVWHDSPSAMGNHPAAFDPDECAACHDYNANLKAKLGLNTTTNAVTLWKGGTTGNTANNMGFGAAPIARRVHGVHFADKRGLGGNAGVAGAGVNYPFEIYNGHNVSIKFPQDPKNCESCHTATTSGTW
ncbi:MAG: OmcA/MtrC family decaheme c-type cytochrome, partial [Gallionella sp.]|nr:OmcA/MtrC family decaheme c-type cytochrome [Gallionella sp.]